MNLLLYTENEFFDAERDKLLLMLAPNKTLYRVFCAAMKALVIWLALCYSSLASFPDWLITDVNVKTHLRKGQDNVIELSNGLISRRFSVTPNFATIDFFSHEKKSSLIRAIQPEAVILFDNVEYNVGGFDTRGMSRAYLNRTALKESSFVDPRALRFLKYETTGITPRFTYKASRGAPADVKWPPPGLHLKVFFQSEVAEVVVNYEMFDNVPILSKWLSIKAKKGPLQFAVRQIEVLSLNWPWSKQGYGWLEVVPELPRGTSIKWTTEDNKELGSFQPLLTCSYDKNFSLPLANGEEFESYKVFEVLVGSNDKERSGLALRRLRRLLAPQSQENPIYFHMTNGSSEAFRFAVDQVSEVGFEMIFYSFGSGFDLEAKDLSRLKADIAYANAKGLEVGGYDLIAWTRRPTSDKWLAVTNETAPSACMASGWYDYLLSKVKRVRYEANLTAIETDGPYSGYSCASITHSHHRNEEDSTYEQSKRQKQFFKELHEMGMYINQPDDYFFYGANKAAMGYNEGQFSLPRWVDLSVSRQGMFDDTFLRIPTEGWMFLPLLNYEGGGPSAWFEPLKDHPTEYNFALAQYFGAGVQACYRGDRIFDTDETKAIVAYWISFYKKYRTILNADLIHVKRADMQGLDAFMHATYKGKIRGLAMVFNPTSEPIEDVLELPLYYTGLSKRALVSLEGMETTSETYILSRDYKIEIGLRLEPKAHTWFVISEP